MRISQQIFPRTVALISFKSKSKKTKRRLSFNQNQKKKPRAVPKDKVR